MIKQYEVQRWTKMRNAGDAQNSSQEQGLVAMNETTDVPKVSKGNRDEVDTRIWLAGKPRDQANCSTPMKGSSTRKAERVAFPQPAISH